MKGIPDLVRSPDTGVIHGSGRFLLPSRTTLWSKQKRISTVSTAPSRTISKACKRSTPCCRPKTSPMIFKTRRKTQPKKEIHQRSALAAGKLMETLKNRLEEQKDRHQGGSKSGKDGARRPLVPMATTQKACASARTNHAIRSAKVWDQREYRDYDNKRGAGHPQHRSSR